MTRSKVDPKAAPKTVSTRGKRKAPHLEEKVTERRSKRLKDIQEGGDDDDEIERLTQTSGSRIKQRESSTSSTSRNTRGRPGKPRNGDMASPSALLAIIEETQTPSAPHESAPENEDETGAQKAEILPTQQVLADSVEDRASPTALTIIDVPKRHATYQSTIKNAAASAESDQHNIMDMDLTGVVNRVRSQVDCAVTVVCQLKAAMVVPDPGPVLEQLYAAVLGQAWHENSTRLLYKSDLDAADFMRALIWVCLKKYIFDVEVLPDILHFQLLERTSMVWMYLAPLVERFEDVGSEAAVNQINDKNWRDEHILPAAKICAYKTGLSLVNHILHCTSAGLSDQQQKRWRNTIGDVCYGALLLKLKMQMSAEACELMSYHGGEQAFSGDDGADDSKMVAFTIEPGILKDGMATAAAENWLVLPKVKLVNR